MRDDDWIEIYDFNAETLTMQYRCKAVKPGTCKLKIRVCPTFYTHGNSGICGPCSINAAMSRERYLIAW